MNDILTLMRALNVTAWGCLAVYMLPGVWAALRGKDIRYGDPMRVSVFTISLVMVGFSLRWLVAPESQLLWVFLHILSFIDAFYIARLAWAYGRGPRV